MKITIDIKGCTFVVRKPNPNPTRYSSITKSYNSIESAAEAVKDALIKNYYAKHSQDQAIA